MVTTVSIVIPTYNRAELLRQALQSTQQLNTVDDVSAEVIVIDNSSTDHTREVLNRFADARTIPVRRLIEARRGLNYCRNLAILNSVADWLIYLDDDVLLDCDWLVGFSEILRQFDADCVVGPVFPWFEAAPAGWLSTAMLASITSSYSLKGHCGHVLDPNRSHEIPGCNFAVRRLVASELRGFHPSLDRSGSGMLAGGDTEFGLRLGRAGKQVVFSPRCKVRHFVSVAKMSKPALRRRWMGLGATARAIATLHDGQPTAVRVTRLCIRMILFWLRSLHCGLRGDASVSFEWQLKACRIKGFLFDAPRKLRRL